MRSTWLRRLATAAAFCSAALTGAETIVVGSKNFPESYILGEIIALLLEEEGFPVTRKLGLGGTKICYDALAVGDIHVYPEYTGTIQIAIKNIDGEPTEVRLASALAPDGVEMLDRFGFNNTYAIAVAADVARQRSLARVSDLVGQRDLRGAVSHEFLERQDGWPALRAAYGLDWTPEGIEHALAYQALADGAIDFTDAYSTDGELSTLDLTVLTDDLAAFPKYFALPLVRTEMSARAKRAIARSANSLTAADMSALNAAALAGEDTASVAHRFLVERGLVAAAEVGANADPPNSGLLDRLSGNVLRHLILVGGAVVPATLTAVLLALAIFKLAWLARTAVYLAGLLQTIPSIALLALLIPLTGIGWIPAVVALFLYALLPILRNAVTALSGIDPTLRRVAVAMGLKPWEQLRHVFLPLAMPSILAGVRTAAVISVGTATLAAFIGAGGLGDPIVKGLSLNSTRLILEGAVPAALLAIVVELVFELLERLLVPGHLRERT